MKGVKFVSCDQENFHNNEISVKQNSTALANI